MDKKFKSLIDELSDYAPKRDRDMFIESRALQVIASATHLLKLIKDSYDPELADDLSKRLIRSIVSEDQEKFCRRIRNIKKDRNNND